VPPVRRPRALDHIRIQGALGQELEVASPGGHRLEHVDERRANDLPLLLRVDHTGQGREEPVARILEHDVESELLRVSTLDLRRLVQAQETVVDKYTGQPLAADRALDEECGHRGIDSAAEPAHDASVPDLFGDPGRRLVEKRRHGPVARAPAHGLGKVSQDVDAPLGVRDLGMKEQPVEASCRVFHRCDRCVGARGDHTEPRRRVGDQIAVTRPHANVARERLEEWAVALHPDRGMPEFPLRGRLDTAAEHVRHELHAVADAEHRNTEVEDAILAPWRTLVTNTRWAARQNQPSRTARGQFAEGRLEREDLRVDLELAQAPGDELRVLGAEIEDQERLMSHARPTSRGDDWNPVRTPRSVAYSITV